MWQMGGLGPMAGQNGHFRSTRREKIPYAIDRYTKEVNRLYGVLDARSPAPAITSPAPTTRIADMAIFPWVRTWKRSRCRWTTSRTSRPGTSA